MENPLRDILKPTLSLFLICLVVTAALALTQAVTRDKIAERERKDAENARKELLARADRFERIDSIDEIIDRKPELKVVAEAYRGLDDSSIAGYVFTAVARGYGGDMKITVGIGADGTITGVKIGENKETPGLGSKAKDEPFISQFRGIVPDEPLKVVKSGKSKPEEIDAISGATITSRAVVNAVQASIDMAAELSKKEGAVK